MPGRRHPQSPEQLLDRSGSSPQQIPGSGHPELPEQPLNRSGLSPRQIHEVAASLICIVESGNKLKCSEKIHFPGDFPRSDLQTAIEDIQRNISNLASDLSGPIRHGLGKVLLNVIRCWKDFGEGADYLDGVLSSDESFETQRRNLLEYFEDLADEVENIKEDADRRNGELERLFSEFSKQLTGLATVRDDYRKVKAECEKFFTDRQRAEQEKLEKQIAEIESQRWSIYKKIALGTGLTILLATGIGVGVGLGLCAIASATAVATTTAATTTAVATTTTFAVTTGTVAATTTAVTTTTAVATTTAALTTAQCIAGGAVAGGGTLVIAGHLMGHTLEEKMQHAKELKRKSDELRRELKKSVEGQLLDICQHLETLSNMGKSIGDQIKDLKADWGALLDYMLDVIRHLKKAQNSENLRVIIKNFNRAKEEWGIVHQMATKLDSCKESTQSSRCWQALQQCFQRGTA